MARSTGMPSYYTPAAYSGPKLTEPRKSHGTRPGNPSARFTNLDIPRDRKAEAPPKTQAGTRNKFQVVRAER
ncbi:hypothetical protein HYALB_00003404 [Hymenoscyphus albidus]|uniref:Uncharacterized protein n=1 Tax=Hymenoscyphus albidus TaxID=595503 RepID=A0A9N9PWH8_9HELO|nr:hypothetical protein HYALB_00003404 [Hymenoscyphus albidus]